ncbi:MAG: M48 family metallopeptidase [Pseudolabrys sp.]|nr:M48 family metallopeptidase [Pseudolabrys sp.]
MQNATNQPTGGAGIFFDGQTSARQTVTVGLGASGLSIAGPDGAVLAAWPYDDIEELAWPGHVLRLGRRGPGLERLEISDPALAAAIDVHAHHVDRTGTVQRRQRQSVIGWSVAATLALVVGGYYGVPALAEKAAPLVPAGLERRMGDAVDMQVRSSLDTRNLGEGFECGAADGEKPGRAALEKMVGRLASAGPPTPLRVTVVRRDEPNAIALPGGQIYVFHGLIAKADNADEIAGVIAHEIGHIAHRDGTKAVLQAGGLSFLFGMLLGDFVGGGAVVFTARKVLQSSYTREAETAADAYAAMLMNRAQGDVRALGTLLARIGGAHEPGIRILLDHPETRARVAALNRMPLAQTPVPFLNPGEFAALKRICAGR